jgi:DNA-binding winged helix-turn-helix (wHTH) protein/tetratricopeptide (TPR) repeat protein
MESGVFEFGAFRLDVDKSVLWRDRELVPLTPKALSLLRVLVERGGDVVSKSELMARVWPDTVVEEGNLTVLVAALRRSLDPRPGGGSFIQTVPRRGYRFDAPLRTANGSGRLGIAVLPFATLGAHVDLHAGVAFADALIGRLTAHESLLVRPTLAVAHYARAPRPPREAAQELGVDAVLTGTIQRQGGRVRVSVHFVPRRTTLKAWAKTFDADAADLFAMQDLVAEGVTRAIGPRPGEPSPASRHPSARDGAEEAYLRGRFFWSRFSPHGVGRALAYFGEAMTLDPGYAAPYAGLADAHIYLGLSGLAPSPGAWDHALDAAGQALARDNRHAEAYAARAWARLFRDRDWATAGADLDKAVSLAPAAASVHIWRGVFRLLVRDLDGARADVHTAREIDVLSLVGLASQCLVHEYAGEFEESAELARRGVELRPDCFLGYRCLGVALLRLGRAEPGLQALRRAVRLSEEGPVMRTLLAWALATTGDHDGARRRLDELDALASTTFVSPSARARVLVALGDLETALQRLAEGAAQGDWLAVFAPVDASLAPLRDHPAFREFVETIRYPGA